MVEDVRNDVGVTASWLFIDFDYSPIDFIDVTLHIVAHVVNESFGVSNEHFDFIGNLTFPCFDMLELPKFASQFIFLSA